jgi:hypothetical protein
MLTQLLIDKAKPTSEKKVTKLFDDGGLHLCLFPNGKKRWWLRCVDWDRRRMR